MIIAGIDYSITSPAICILKNDAGDFHFFTNKRKKLELHHQFHAYDYMEWETQTERFVNFSTWALSIINANNVDHVFIENYAYAAKGKVFNIAENTGLLKYFLWRQHTPFTTIEPTVIKKFATGKGNANKAAMELAFIKKTGFDPRLMCKQTEKQDNPSSDIADSYFIARCGESLLSKGNS